MRESALAIGGNLFKLSEHIKIWRSRYFILDDNLLVHFLDVDQQSSPRRIIKLDECKLTELSIFKGKFAFSLAHPSFRNDYILASDDENYCKEWIQRINSVVCRGENENSREKSPKSVRSERSVSLSLNPPTASKDLHLGLMEIEDERWKLDHTDALGNQIWMKPNSIDSHAFISVFCKFIGVFLFVQMIKYALGIQKVCIILGKI
jgi:hypothetical protein